MRTCFGLRGQRKEHECDLRGFLTWKYSQIQSWLQCHKLQHLSIQFTKLEGKDLLFLTPEKCQREFALSSADAATFKYMLKNIKAYYVDHLVRQGVPLPFVSTTTQSFLSNTPRTSPAPSLSPPASPQPSECHTMCNPIKGVTDPIRRMQTVSRIFYENFGIRGKSFTIEQVHMTTGIPIPLIHDVINTLESVQMISPQNYGYVWWGTQRLQLQKEKSLRSSCENLSTMLNATKTVLNLSLVAPWVVEVIRQGEDGVMMSSIVTEIMRQCPLDGIVSSKERLTEVVRDACIVLVAVGVLDKQKNADGYAFGWNLPVDENQDPASPSPSLSRSQTNSTKQRMGTAVIQSKKYFDVPGQIPRPCRVSGGGALQEYQINELVVPSTIETADPGSVTTLRSKFAQLHSTVPSRQQLQQQQNSEFQ